MQLLILLVTGLVAVANCIPTHANPASQVAKPTFNFMGDVNNTKHSANEQRCDVNAFTYVNQGSEASPLVADCNQMIANIQEGGTWRVMPGEQRAITQFQSCAFGIDNDSQGIILIGSGDIITIVTASITKFAFNSQVGGRKVGSMGELACSPYMVPTNWGLY